MAKDTKQSNQKRKLEEGETIQWPKYQEGVIMKPYVTEEWQTIQWSKDTKGGNQKP